MWFRMGLLSLSAVANSQMVQSRWVNYLIYSQPDVEGETQGWKDLCVLRGFSSTAITQGSNFKGLFHLYFHEVKGPILITILR